MIQDQSTIINKAVQHLQKKATFQQVQRMDTTNFNLEEQMLILQKIGEGVIPNFVIDGENSFLYRLGAIWAHNSTEMVSEYLYEKISPKNALKRGLYISGKSQSGKSVFLEILIAYLIASNIGVFFGKETEPYWFTLTQIARASDICTTFSKTGDIEKYKNARFLVIQDLGSEPKTSSHFSNEFNVLRELIEYRGDNAGMITFVTSNYPLYPDKFAKDAVRLQKWEDGFNKRYGERAIKRLRAMCNWVPFEGNPRR